MATELWTLVIVVESVEFVLRRGRHDSRRERAQCTMHLGIARNQVRWLYGVAFQQCVDQVRREVKSLDRVRTSILEDSVCGVWQSR